MQHSFVAILALGLRLGTCIGGVACFLYNANPPSTGFRVMTNFLFNLSPGRQQRWPRGPEHRWRRTHSSLPDTQRGTDRDFRTLWHSSPRKKPEPTQNFELNFETRKVESTQKRSRGTPSLDHPGPISPRQCILSAASPSEFPPRISLYSSCPDPRCQLWRTQSHPRMKNPHPKESPSNSSSRRPRLSYT